MNILNWLNNPARWSDLGHGLTGFFLMTISKGFVGVTTSLIALTILVLIKEFIIDRHTPKEGLIKSSYYMAGILLASMP